MPNSFARIKRAAAEVMREIVDVEMNRAEGGGVSFDKKGLKRLEKIAYTRNVSTDFDPDFSVLFVHGLINLINSRNSGDLGRSNHFFILQQLVLANFVDKKMIIGIVEFGENNEKNAWEANATIGAIYNMLVPGISGDPKPDDDRFAIAIRAGLFEMSLKLLVRFGNDNNYNSGDMLEYTMREKKLLIRKARASFVDVA